MYASCEFLTLVFDPSVWRTGAPFDGLARRLTDSRGVWRTRAPFDGLARRLADWRGAAKTTNGSWWMGSTATYMTD